MTPVFPTSYFGSIEYYRSICSFDFVQIEAKEHFVKQTARSRCEILGSNGVLRLSIPVVRNNGSHTSIDEIIIDDRENWRKNHWKSIESAYASSAYFDHYGIEIEKLIFNKDLPYLLDFNQSIHLSILSWLDMEKASRYTTVYELPSETLFDFRSKNFEDHAPSDHNKYTQVFREKNDCIQNLSILDIIMNQGPMARTFLF